MSSVTETKLAEDLLSPVDSVRNNAIQQVMMLSQNGDSLGKEAVENALGQMAGTASALSFYTPGGMYGIGSKEIDKSRKEIVKLAKKRRLLNDPAYTQKLIIKTASIQNEIVSALQSTGRNALHCYVLLGVQMQAATLLLRKAL